MNVSSRPTTLITDFDNTLYDWFHMWHQSFGAMIKEIVLISGVSESILLPQIRKIHQENHTSEYSFLLQELPCLREKYPQEDILTIFDPAIHAYRRARKASLQLYNGVKETLKELQSKGILIVVYTESLSYYSSDRIYRLELDGLVDFLYTPPNHELPNKVQLQTSNNEARLLHTKHRHVPKGVQKPNPEVLLDIIHAVDRSPAECIYLGDSLMKDIAMAQQANILDVWAEYGIVQKNKEYVLLQQVSHWTDEDVEREKITSRQVVTPSYTISQFSEILNFFEG